MNIPSMQEWLKNNPGKGINAYYKKFPKQPKSTQNKTQMWVPRPPVVEPPPVVVPPPPVIKQQPIVQTPPPPPRVIYQPPPQQPIYQHIPQKKKTSVDLGTLFSSILVIGAFFLPWLDTQLLTLFDLDIVGTTGQKLPDILGKIYEGKGLPDYQLMSIFVIPVGAAIVLLSESLRFWLGRALGQIIVICALVYWTSFLMQLITYTSIEKTVELDMMQIFSLGFYLSVLGGLYYSLDLLRGIFGGR